MRQQHEPMTQYMLDMWNFPRSLTGKGVRDTIRYLQDLIPGLEMHSVPSGTKAFDWEVPDEWNVKSAYLEHQESGDIIADFSKNHLHIVGYSVPFNGTLPLADLQEHLHSIPGKPDAIPYVTSYYKRRWGFCLADNTRRFLRDGYYRVHIDTTLEHGVMNYADIIIPGETEEEVLLSTYICHPNMANDNLSGIVVTAMLAKWLQSLPKRRLTYRIVFVPETIGALVYLSRHLDEMKRKTVAGYVVTCVGSGGSFSLIESRHGNTLSDRAARCAVNGKPWTRRPYTERGSDERQYCWPGIDLPISSITLDKYGEYKEYHTSLDDMSIVSELNLNEALKLYKNCLTIIDHNKIYKPTTIGEPFLTKHDAYPSESPDSVPDILNILAYCDGENDVIDIASQTCLDEDVVIDHLMFLEDKGLVA